MTTKMATWFMKQSSCDQKVKKVLYDSTPFDRYTKKVNVMMIQKWWKSVSKGTQRNFIPKMTYLNMVGQVQSIESIIKKYHYLDFEYGSMDFVPERTHRCSEFLSNLEGVEAGKFPITELLEANPILSDNKFTLSFLISIIDRRLFQGLAYLPNHERNVSIVWHNTNKISHYPELERLSNKALLQLCFLIEYLCLSKVLIYEWIAVEIFQRWNYYPSSSIKSKELEEIVEKNPEFHFVLKIRHNYYMMTLGKFSYQLENPFFK